MRIGTIEGRAVLVVAEGRCVDVAARSGGRFSADLPSLFARWDDLREWSSGVDDAGSPFEPGDLGCPVLGARQIFAIGLNYADHVREAGVEAPPQPAVFTKFASSLGRPFGAVALPVGDTDWEAELVVVIGRGGRDVAVADAWEHVAGLAVGQDLSERRRQLVGGLPQFSLGKSFADFSPVGPYLVTPDEVPDRDDLAIGCTLNGEQVQKSRTSHLLFPVAELIADLSAVVELYPGDVIFTGTPPGVGMARTPPRFIGDGDELVTTIEGIGELRHTFHAVSARGAA